MINTNLAAAVKRAADHLAADMARINAQPTKRGNPRKRLVEHAQRRAAFLRSMLDSVEQDLSSLS